VSGYQVERGDVLLSIQLILTAEEEGLRSGGRWPSPGSVRPAVAAASAHVVPRGVAGPARTVPPQVRHSLPPVRKPPSAPSLLPSMVDPMTGAGTADALRRDLSLVRAAVGAGQPAAAAAVLSVEGLDQVRLTMGTEAAVAVLRALVEVAPFALQARDRIYRAGRTEMALLLPGADHTRVEAARAGLELALSRVLADRGFPEVRLAVRPLGSLAAAS